MKKIILITVLPALILLLNSNNANAQVKDNVVKFNLFGAVVGQYQFAYERAIKENMSVQLSAGMISRNIEIDFTSGTSTTTSTQENRGFIIIPEYRYYFNEAPKGVYAGAFFRYRSVTSTASYDDGTLGEQVTAERERSAIGGGVLVGYQILISDLVALDIQLGPQYKSVSDEITDPGSGGFVFDAGEGDGIGVRFAFNMGIAF